LRTFKAHQTLFVKIQNSWVNCFFPLSLLALVLSFIYHNFPIAIPLFFAGMFDIMVLVITFSFIINGEKGRVTTIIRFFGIPIRIVTYQMDAIKDIWLSFKKIKYNVGVPSGGEIDGTAESIRYELSLYFKLTGKEEWKRVASFKLTDPGRSYEPLLKKILEFFPHVEMERNIRHLDILPKRPWKNTDKIAEILKTVNDYELPPPGLEQKYIDSIKPLSIDNSGDLIIIGARGHPTKDCLNHVSNSNELKCVVMWCDDIEEIPESEQMPNLIILDLSRNKISRIEHLQSYLNLKSLNLSHNNISRIENLGCLEHLEELWLCSNNIERIEGLDKLPNLRRLYLGDNHVVRIENLESLKNLEILCLDRNQLTRIENLGALHELRALNLWNNRITSRAGLETCPWVKVVHLQGNPIP